MNLRSYQLEAVNAIRERFSEGSKSTLLVLPTGTGKTVVFASLIDDWAHGRVLVIAHREELIRQAADKIERVTGEKPDVEMADERADLTGLHGKAKVVVASKDSLHERRRRRFPANEFSLIVTDEAHHAVADTYQRVYAHFPDAKHLGVTATPDRLDEEALGQVYQSVAFVYEIMDAIKDGWLVPIRQRVVYVHDLDFSSVRTTAGDLNQSDLATIMETESVLHEVADPVVRISEGRRTLIFATTVAQAEALAAIINRHKPDSARWVCGETNRDTRRQMLRDYSEGGFQYLVNVGVLTEGFDEPGIQLVVMARPTKSRCLYAQMIGRGTRPVPGLVDGISEPLRRQEAIRNSAKPSLEVLDFSGNAGRHKLVHVADILGGAYTDEEVYLAVEAATKSGVPEDVAESLEKAKVKVNEDAQKAKVKIRTEYSLQTIDPFDVLGIEPPRRRGWDSHDPITEKQRAVLERAGIPITAELTRPMASRLIGRVIERRYRGLCTFKQSRLLKRFGYNPDGITFDKASGLLDVELRRRQGVS